MKDYTKTWVIGFVVFALLNILPNLILNQEISFKKYLFYHRHGFALILRQELTERLL